MYFCPGAKLKSTPMTVKEHYDKHLSQFYAWMVGDFEAKTKEFKKFLKDQSILPQTNKIALDLGAGHGIQSIPLAELGFQVVAVDFSQALLNELAVNAKDLNILTINNNIKGVERFADSPELIVCCGDTLAHLEDKAEVDKFIEDCAKALCSGGKLMLSFRDYSKEVQGSDRFIQVKSDDTRILTCVLEYGPEQLNVTDVLYQKTKEGWKQKISSYKKVRLIAAEVLELIEKKGLTMNYNQNLAGMITVIALKP